MHGIRMMQGLAKGRMQSGYEELVKVATTALQSAGKPMPADPSQAIVMLPDWDGSRPRAWPPGGR